MIEVAWYVQLLMTIIPTAVGIFLTKWVVTRREKRSQDLNNESAYTQLMKEQLTEAHEQVKLTREELKITREELRTTNNRMAILEKDVRSLRIALQDNNILLEEKRSVIKECYNCPKCDNAEEECPALIRKNFLKAIRQERLNVHPELLYDEAISVQKEQD